MTSTITSPPQTLSSHTRSTTWPTRMKANDKKIYNAPDLALYCPTSMTVYGKTFAKTLELSLTMQGLHINFRADPGHSSPSLKLITKLETNQSAKLLQSRPSCLVTKSFEGTGRPQSNLMIKHWQTLSL